MRNQIVLFIAGSLFITCGCTTPKQISNSTSTQASATPALVQITTSTPPALSRHYASANMPIQFDYPDGWDVQEYQHKEIKYVKRILLSSQPTFFADPLNPANSGVIIDILSWTSIVRLDAAVMTPDPPRFSKMTPNPATVANTIGFYSEWSSGYCLGFGCEIDLKPVHNTLLDDRQAVYGHGKMYLCRNNQPTPEGVSTCELDIYGIIVETTNPDLYIGLYGKGQELTQYDALLLKIAATAKLR